MSDPVEYTKLYQRVVPLQGWLEDVLSTALDQEQGDALDGATDIFPNIDEEEMACDYFVKDGNLIIDVYGPREDIRDGC